MKYLVEDRYGDEIGVADENGNFYPNGEKCKRSIKNRVFAPKWVKEAWSKGLIVEVEKFELRQDPRGRFYPVVRGRAVENKEVGTRVRMHGDYFYLYKVFLSGYEKEAGCVHISKWRTAPEWIKSYCLYDKTIRSYRIKNLFYSRYDKIKTMKILSGIEMVRSVRIKDRHTAVVEISYKQEVERTWWRYRGFSDPDGDTVFVHDHQIEMEEVEKTEYEIPISYVFDQEVISTEKETKIKRYRSEYESNDGRSTRYDDSDSYIEYDKVTIKFTPKKEFEEAKEATWWFCTYVFDCDVSRWTYSYLVL